MPLSIPCHYDAVTSFLADAPSHSAPSSELVLRYDRVLAGLPGRRCHSLVLKEGDSATHSGGWDKTPMSSYFHGSPAVPAGQDGARFVSQCLAAPARHAATLSRICKNGKLVASSLMLAGSMPPRPPCFEQSISEGRVRLPSVSLERLPSCCSIRSDGISADASSITTAKIGQRRDPPAVVRRLMFWTSR